MDSEPAAGKRSCASKDKAALVLQSHQVECCMALSQLASNVESFHSTNLVYMYHWLQMKLIQGFKKGVIDPNLAAYIDLGLCFALDDSRLSRTLLMDLPLDRLKEVVCFPGDGAPRRSPKTAALEAFAASYLEDPGSTKVAVMARLLLVATWVGACVPAVVEWLQPRTLRYSELKALGASLKEGSSGPVMDLLQVSGRTHYEIISLSQGSALTSAASMAATLQQQRTLACLTA